MPLELQIIRAREFIRLGAHDRFDLAASKAALAHLVQACRKRGINQALLDLRAVQPGPTPIFSARDLATLVGTFREIGFSTDQRLAILYTCDPHRRARLFAFLSTLHGWNVAAFERFEDAVIWLAEEDTFDTESCAKASAVPIKAAPSNRARISASSRLRRDLWR